ncbi:MAG: hypothetical protein LBQ90_06380 [Synergistaceae bacterium]|jgi:hypothetical protein|nr:hypothetical protein [Synergistaceae bacterium]
MREFISTMCLGHEIRLLWQPEREEIPDCISQGFVPIEMAEGQESFVDFRCLDHHNAWSHLPSACVTALQYYGTLESPASVMVNHTDADCVLTGLTLMGLLPLNVLEKFNVEVGLLDTDPLGTDVSLLTCGDVIQVWKAGMASLKQSGWSWLYGLQLFLDIFRNGEHYKAVKSRLAEREQERRRVALEDYEKAVRSPSGRVLLVAPSRVYGFDVQLCRQSEFPVESLQGWRHWCVIGQIERSGSVTLSCPNKSVAEGAFGPGGLLNVYPRLPTIGGKTWGGREAVGGSPRGALFPVELLPKVLEIIEGALTFKQEMA